MKQTIGLLAAVVASVATVSCDSSQGLFSRRKSPEKTEQTASNAGKDAKEQAQEADERQADRAGRRKTLQEKSQAVKETLHEKSKQIKAAIEGEESVAKSSDDAKQNQAKDSNRDVAMNESRKKEGDSDRSEDSAEEQRIRKRLGLSDGSGSSETDRYPDERRDDRERPSYDRSDNDRQTNMTGQRYTNENRRYEDDRPDQGDRRSYSNRDFSGENRSQTGDRYDDPRQNRDRYAYQDRYANQDRYSNQDRYRGQSDRNNRYRYEDDRYRTESDRYRDENDDRQSAPRINERESNSRSMDDENRRSGDDRNDANASERKQLTDRIGEQIDSIDEQLTRLDQGKSGSNTKARTQRQGVGRELEKLRNDLISTYYQVQRGSAENWKQTKRQADRLVYDAEERIEKLDQKKNE